MSEVQFTASPDSHGTLTIRSEGLVGQGWDELVIESVPEPLAQTAATLGFIVVQWANAHGGWTDGDILHMPTQGGGLFVRIDRIEPGLSRVSDVAEDDPLPHIALSTLLNWDALQLADQGDTDGAIALLQQAVELVPRREDGEPSLILPYNWNGALSALFLAELDTLGRPGWVDEAMERSFQVRAETLGDPRTALQDLDPEVLEDIAGLLVHAQLSNLNNLGTDEVLAFTGPLARPSGLLVQLDRTVVPIGQGMALLGGSVMDALFDTRTPALAARVVASSPPFELFLRFAHVRELHHETAQPVQLDFGWIPGMRLVSYVLADIACLVAGGASLDDLPAHYGLVDDPDAKARVATAAEAFGALA